MTRLLLSSLLAFSALATGCATSQNVTLGQLTPARTITKAALVPQDGNSAAMDDHVRTALMMQGVEARDTVYPGTRQNDRVDAIVGYTDVWRWDLTMYLRSLTIQVFDARTGNLLAMGRWDNSAFHGFQDAGHVTRNLMNEVFAKIRTQKAP